MILKMKDKVKILKIIKNVLEKEGAKKISLFGSFARGENKPGSDIDILVEFKERKSLLKIVRIERELSETLEIKVDLLTEKSISPYLISSIRKEMVVIYE